MFVDIESTRAEKLRLMREHLHAQIGGRFQARFVRRNWRTAFTRRPAAEPQRRRQPEGRSQAAVDAVTHRSPLVTNICSIRSATNWLPLLVKFPWLVIGISNPW